MFNHFLMLCKNIKSYDINRTLKKAVLKKKMISFFNNTKAEKIIGRAYSKNPGMQTLIEESMIDIC